MITISTQSKSKRQIWKWIVYPILLLIAALFAYYSVSDLTGAAGAPVSVFGYQITSVHTADLEPSLAQGDAAIVDETPAKSIAVGDIVVYQSGTQTAVGQVVSTRFISGEPLFSVQPGANAAEDFVTEDQLYGTASRYIPYIGYVMDFMDTPVGLVCCIGIPVLLVILIEIFSTIAQAKRHLRNEEETENSALRDWVFGTTPQEEPPAPEPEREQSYTAGSFSPQYAYHPQNGNSGSFRFTPEQEDIASVTQPTPERPETPADPKPEPQEPVQPIIAPEPQEPVQPVAQMPVAQTQSAQEPEAAPTVQQENPPAEDKRLSLKLSGDESSEFTVNGINIVYEDDTLNLDVDPAGAPMRIKVRMRDDEAQLLFKTDEKITRFAILNQEGKPRRISISGKEEDESSEK